MSNAKRISDKRLKEIAGYDVNFDEDIPEFTDEQLAKFSSQKNIKVEESINQLRKAEPEEEAEYYEDYNIR